MSEDPVAWLRAQVEARLDVARHAASQGGEWRTGCTCEGECRGYPSCEEVICDGIHIYAEGGHDADQAAHIALNDPRDTIARCEAELAILDEHAAAKARRAAEADDYAAWVRDEASVDRPVFDGPGSGLIAGLERAVRLLIGGYRHCEGYREEWGT